MSARAASRLSRSALLASTILALAPIAGAAYAAETAPAIEEQNVVSQVLIESERAKRSAGATGLDLSLRETPQSVTVMPRADPGLRADQRQRPAGPGHGRQCREGRDRPHLLQLARLRHHQLPGRRRRPAADLGHPVRRPRHRPVRPGRDRPRRQRHDDRHGQSLGDHQLYPQAPDQDFQATASASYGSWDDKRLEADVSGPLNASGTVTGRLVYANEEGLLPRLLQGQSERLLRRRLLGHHAQAEGHRRLFAAGQPGHRRAVGRPAADLFGRLASTIRARPRPRPTGPTGTPTTRPRSPS
jgi:outer membrane receptor for ferric coprogen and ferric-rhodotorulic acid